MMGRRIRPLRLERLDARWPLDAAAVLAGSEWPAAAEGEEELVPDFSLLDTNPASSTYNQSVSPRDFVGQISAWYFGHAT
jgi:hypothetical protein